MLNRVTLCTWSYFSNLSKFKNWKEYTINVAIEDCSRAPDYVTKQDHLPTKMAKKHLSQEGGEGGNHYKLADKGRVCLFAYLCGGGGEEADILHFSQY